MEKQFGENTALIFHDGNDNFETNYKTLNSTSNRIASALLEKIKSKNLTPNNDEDWIICVCMKPSDHNPSFYLEVWR